MQLDDFQRDNRANWNDRAVVHAASATYGLDLYRSDPAHVSHVVAFDGSLIGDLDGRSVAHLQCHIGTDTISLERLGASRVVGLDFAEDAIAIARELANSSGATATTFVVGNVYDAAELIEGPIDLVYTSVGAINWIADLDRWAAAVSELLLPGGTFYIRDGHPFMFIFEEVDGHIVPHYDYWTSFDAPHTWNESTTYTDGDSTSITNTRHHEWNHSIPDVVNALVNNGMRIDKMAEHDFLDWPLTPSWVPEGDVFYPPPSVRGKFPQQFSIWATKQ